MNEKIYIYPTDTVWGIGCNIFSEKSFIEIAKIKKTDPTKPISILYHSYNDLALDVNLPTYLPKTLFTFLANKEVTFLFPSSFAKSHFPKYLFKLSPFISIRFLENPMYGIMHAEIGAPFFTTSLNITNEPPLLTLDLAKEFKEKYAPDARLIPGLNGHKLSGVSSTIIEFDEMKFKILRVGKNAEEIKNYLSSLNFDCI
jgi:L-threonylcarbamoyladenylate synthase